LRMRLTCPNACARKNAGVIDLTDTGRGLLHDLDAESGAFRNTTAFLSEKLARIKLLLEIPQAVNWHGSRSLKPLPWALKAS
jgi:hypothetical protein